jgi:hypothetical protein
MPEEAVVGPADAGDKKEKKGKGKAGGGPRAKLKLWLRNLPPGLAEEQLREAVDELAPGSLTSMDWFRLVPASKQVPSVTVYMHFKSENALYAVHGKLDGHKFVDAHSKEWKAIAEYAPHQKIPRKKVIDRREGTIEKDPDFLSFLEEFEQQRSFKIESAEAWLERREQDAAAKSAEGADSSPAIVSTPLLEFVRQKMERNIRDKRDRKAREDERRRKLQEDARQQQRAAARGGVSSARGGRGGRGGVSAAPGAQAPPAIAARPTSAGARSSTGGGQSGRTSEGQQAGGRGQQGGAPGGQKVRPSSAVPAVEASQAQQSKGGEPGKGGGREKPSSKQASHAGGKSNVADAHKTVQPQPKQIQQRPQQNQQRPQQQAQQKEAGSSQDAGHNKQHKGGGGKEEAPAAGGGGGGGGAEGGAGARKSKSARPVGVYRPKPRGGGQAGQ